MIFSGILVLWLALYHTKNPSPMKEIADLTNSTLKEMTDYILNIDTGISEKLLKSIIIQGQYHAKANNDLKEKAVEKFIINAIAILRNFYLHSLDKYDTRHPKAEFCTQECKNKYNTNKSRGGKS